MSAALHLVRLGLDARALYAFAQRSKAVGRELDEGYAVHALFAALFDHGAPPEERVAPKPFCITSQSARTLDVLGYSPVDHRTLAERARTFADPYATEVCDMTSAVSRVMPTEFAAGTRLGFSVRACPIRRVARMGPMTRERAEVDAFLAASWEAPSTELVREDVYWAWLRGELAKDSAATVVATDSTSFHLARFRRRTHGPNREARRPPQRPDVVFQGTLDVGSPEAFARLLARGVGRHRAFGFGMLLLRPARRG